MVVWPPCKERQLWRLPHHLGRSFDFNLEWFWHGGLATMQGEAALEVAAPPREIAPLGVWPPLVDKD
jgi:hypothetical protein